MLNVYFELHCLRVKNFSMEMKVFWSAQSPIIPTAAAQRCPTAHWCANGRQSPALPTQYACGQPWKNNI